MKRKPLGVKNKNECYYDFYEDYDVLNADFRHYHNRSLTEVLQDKDIKWPEFSAMMSNLGMTSSIGYLVSIRGEKDPVKIKKFTPNERKIYLDWKKKHSKKLNNSQRKDLSSIRANAFIDGLKQMYGNKVKDNRL